MSVDPHSLFRPDDPIAIISNYGPEMDFLTRTYVCPIFPADLRVPPGVGVVDDFGILLERAGARIVRNPQCFGWRISFRHVCRHRGFNRCARDIHGKRVLLAIILVVLGATSDDGDADIL